MKADQLHACLCQISNLLSANPITKKLHSQLMELSSLIFSFIFFHAMYQPSMILSQQVYPSESLLNCSGNPSTAKGYLCNGPQTTCQSFVTYRAVSPYDTPENIASHLASEVSSIIRINNLVSNQTIPQNKLIVVPVSCSCFGNLYQHYAPYTVERNDTYYLIAKDTYQGLTTCQSLMSQNYYDAESIPVGAELTVPVRCACPSENQTASGVVALVSYVAVAGDTLTAIGDVFGGISAQSILEANVNLTAESILISTPILIPLRNESCNLRTKNFFCQCPNGQFTYQNEDGSVCAADSGKDRKGFPAKLVIILGVGIALGLLGLVLCGYYSYLFLKKRKQKALKEKFFRQNGGIMLKESLISSGNGETTKLFTGEELQRATDSYNESRILGRGGYGTVYKGMLLDGTIVAVKVSKAIDKSQIKQFINEVVILSQINHRNVVKLLGCCLETEFPLLVYEFISNGTLSSHIHVKDEGTSLSWESRFRIACEVAGAVAYMHSAASIPIFHRDIKPTNILLDDNYSAKVSDFGTSRSAPHDKTHLTTAVQGTFGYLDPEYFQSSQFTDKSDVYSFGVVLLELLTGEKPISFVRGEDEINLVAYFIASTKENRLFQLLDARVAKEAKEEDVLAVAGIAKRCLKLSGKKRPTMKEVAMELEYLRKSQKSIEIDEQLKLLAHEDEGTIMRPDEGQTQESIDDNIFAEMEPASI